VCVCVRVRVCLCVYVRVCVCFGVIKSDLFTSNLKNRYPYPSKRNIEGNDFCLGQEEGGIMGEGMSVGVCVCVCVLLS